MLKVTPKVIHNSGGHLLAKIGDGEHLWFNGNFVHNTATIATMLPAIQHFADHGTFCPPPELEWTNNGPWETAGCYLVFILEWYWYSLGPNAFAGRWESREEAKAACARHAAGRGK